MLWRFFDQDKMSLNLLTVSCIVKMHILSSVERVDNNGLH